MFDPVWSERTTPHAWKHRVTGLGVKFAKPIAQFPDNLLAKRGTAFLTAFPATTYMGSIAEHNVLPTEADEL
jgi:hypothetical protein